MTHPVRKVNPIFIVVVMSQENPPPTPDSKAGPPKSTILEFLEKSGGPKFFRLEITTKKGETISRTFDSRDGQDVSKSLDDIRKFFPSEEEGHSSPTTRVAHGPSGDWVPQNKDDQKDVTPSHPVKSESASQHLHSTHTTTTDFNPTSTEGSSKDSFSKLIHAATLAKPHPMDQSSFEPVAGELSTRFDVKPTSFATELSTRFDVKPKFDKKKKSRKFVPNEKEYVDKCKDQGEFTLLQMDEIFRLRRGG